jgi:hypothetical protein
MLKYLLLGFAVAIMVAPAGAQAAEFSCVPGPTLHQAFIDQGYPQNNQQVMHLIVDRQAGNVTVWETSPEFPDVHRTSYAATFSGTTAAWTIGDIQDGQQAHGSFDFGTNVLTTVDPDGDADEWSCSAG